MINYLYTKCHLENITSPFFVSISDLLKAFWGFQLVNLHRRKKSCHR